LRSILKSAPSWAFGALFLLALGSTAIAQTDTETEPSSNAPGASPPEQVSPSEEGSPTEQVSPPESASPTEQVAPKEQVSPPQQKAPAEKVSPPEPASPTKQVSPSEQMTRFLGTAIPGTNYIASASRMATAHAQNSKLRKIALDLAKDQTSVANSLAAWVNVSGPVVTRKNPYAAAGGGATRVTAPRLLPDQVSLLQQLSQLRGQNFDSLYVSSVKETLAQLQTLFRDFGEGGGDAGLRAIAKWELPKLEETISALNAM
jgi:predicted outer membrane protein